MNLIYPRTKIENVDFGLKHSFLGLTSLSPNKIWFSHRENRWEVVEGPEKPRFHLTPKKEIWDLDSCTIGLARTLGENKLRVVVRSKTNKNSKYMGNKPVELRFMLGFDVSIVSEPKAESYTARENLPEKKEGPKNRWVFQLDDDYWIWEWAQDGRDIHSSQTYKLFQLIRDELSRHSKTSDNIFDVELDVPDFRIIPVIYQPAVDALGNFVREVHCAEKPTRPHQSNEVEVTIIFNNEQLRKHAYANRIYEGFRRLFYGRKLDIETFKILVRKDIADNAFILENIYSDNRQLEDDDVHGDRPPPPPPEHRIKYYFIDHNHPVVFVNTSNHAMAEHDANHRIWKWEYVPWLNNAPIKLGSKTRKEIEKKFKPLLKFW